MTEETKKPKKQTVVLVMDQDMALLVNYSMAIGQCMQRGRLKEALHVTFLLHEHLEEIGIEKANTFSCTFIDCISAAWPDLGGLELFKSKT